MKVRLLHCRVSVDVVTDQASSIILGATTSSSLQVGVVWMHARRTAHAAASTRDPTFVGSSCSGHGCSPAGGPTPGAAVHVPAGGRDASSTCYNMFTRRRWNFELIRSASYAAVLPVGSRSPRHEQECSCRLCHLGQPRFEAGVQATGWPRLGSSWDHGVSACSVAGTNKAFPLCNACLGW